MATVRAGSGLLSGVGHGLWYFGCADIISFWYMVEVDMRPLGERQYDTAYIFETLRKRDVSNRCWVTGFVPSPEWNLIAQICLCVSRVVHIYSFINAFVYNYQFIEQFIFYTEFFCFPSSSLYSIFENCSYFFMTTLLSFAMNIYIKKSLCLVLF